MDVMQPSTQGRETFGQCGFLSLRARSTDWEDEETSVRVLLLGATGLAGQAFADEGRRRGLQVMPVARNDAEFACDIGRLGALDELLHAESPDAVVNCVALVDVAACDTAPGKAWQINARPAGILARWSQRTGRPFLHVSTDHFFTGDAALAHGEAHPVRLVNEYARTKFAAEAMAQTATEALVLRTSIVGIRGWPQPTFAEWALRAVLEDADITLFSDAWTSSIDTESFARHALDLFFDCGVRGLLNLGAREVYTKEAFIRQIARETGCILTKAISCSIHDVFAERPDSLGLDVARAEALLKRQMPTLQDVVRSLLRQDKMRQA